MGCGGGCGNNAILGPCAITAGTLEALGAVAAPPWYAGCGGCYKPPMSPPHGPCGFFPGGYFPSPGPATPVPGARMLGGDIGGSIDIFAVGSMDIGVPAQMARYNQSLAALASLFGSQATRSTTGALGSFMGL